MKKKFEQMPEKLKDFFREAGRRGGNKRNRKVTREQMAEWGRQGAKITNAKRAKQ